MTTKDMSKAGVLVALLAATAAALAQPSVSTEVNQSSESADSSSLTREKKLSIDRNMSNSTTNSKSKERSKELSREKSSSTRTSKEARDSRGFSQEVNINGMLLQEFVHHYEQHEPGVGVPEAQRYFSACKPITAAQRDYPTLNLYEAPESSAAMFQDNAVTGRAYAMPMSVASLRATGSFWSGTPENYPVDPRIPAVRRYAQCRMTASYWIAKAANKVTQKPAHDVDEVLLNISDAFSTMDNDPVLFQQLRQQARDDWSHAQCTPWLKWQGDYRGGEIDCGVFEYKNDKFYVNRRETLTESSIGGTSYKISLNSDLSSSASTELASSSSSRESSSVRSGVTADNSLEIRRGTSMAKTRSNSLSTNNTNRTGAGSTINVTPGH